MMIDTKTNTKQVYGSIIIQFGLIQPGHVNIAGFVNIL